MEHTGWIMLISKLSTTKYWNGFAQKKILGGHNSIRSTSIVNTVAVSTSSILYVASSGKQRYG